MASSLGARQAGRIRTALAGVAGIGLAGTIAAIAACYKPKRDGLRWAIGVATFDATALGLASARSPDLFVDAIRPGRLTIPTYDGSNQATHPDVLLERAASGAPHLPIPW